MCTAEGMCTPPGGQWHCPPPPGTQKVARLTSLQPKCRWRGLASLLEHHPQPESSRVPAEMQPYAMEPLAVHPCKCVAGNRWASSGIQGHSRPQPGGEAQRGAGESDLTSTPLFVFGTIRPDVHLSSCLHVIHSVRLSFLPWFLFCKRVNTTERLCVQQPAQPTLGMDLSHNQTQNSMHDIKLLAMQGPSALIKLI